MATTAEIQQAMMAADRAVPRALTMVRDAYGLKNGDIAVLMGVPIDWVQTRLSGRTKIDHRALAGFCAAFEIEPHVAYWTERSSILRYLADHPSDLRNRETRCISDSPDEAVSVPLVPAA